MKLDIVPTQCNGLDCFSGLIISVAEWLNREYDLIFAKAWNFQFSDEVDEYPDTIGNRLYVRNITCKELLKSYCGISFDYYDDIDPENLLPIIKKELSQQRPVIIHYDIFWCPWSKDYFQKNHETSHTSLVVGFNEHDLYCIDYSPKCVEGILPHEYLCKSIKGLYTFEIEDPLLNNDIKWQDIIRLSISVVEAEDTFNTIRKFGNFIKNSFDPIKEVQRYGIDDFESSPLNWQLSRISESRVLFATTLRALSRKSGIESLLVLADKLESAKPRWSSIMASIIKACVSSNLALLERASRKINELADFEEAIFKCLVMISKDPYSKNEFLNTLDSYKDKQSGIHTDILHFDLSKYCNNRAFDSDEECSYIPDFTGLGSFILKDNNIHRKMMNADYMSFKLADIFKDGYDNVVCKGQTIELPNKRFKKIVILGCSTGGNYSGDLNVIYVDGNSETIKVELPDCYPPSAAFDQQIMWIGQCSSNRIKKTAGFECQFYAQSYDLSYSSNISRIVLPDCQQMHVFAISLIY